MSFILNKEIHFKVLLSSLFFIFTSCTITEYLSRPSLVDNKLHTNKEVQRLVRWTMYGLQETMEPGWKIKITDNYIVKCKYNSENNLQIGFLEGWTDIRSKTITVYSYQPCLAASSLIHELVHTLGYQHGDIAFNRAKVIQRGAIRAFCGIDYEVVDPPSINKERVKKEYKQCLGP